MRKEKRFRNKMNTRLETMESRLKKEKRENLIIGWALIIGVPLLNWIIPKLVGTKFLSFSINPHIGLIDWLFILTGLRFLWKSK